MDATLGDLQRELSSFDIVVCDDWGRAESGDFLCACTATGRVVWIHAKYKGTGKSASAFQDVTSQAIKNLHILQPFSSRRPLNQHRWNDPWKGASIGQTNRIRKGVGDGDACWGEIRSLIQKPDTQREVWIVLGKTIKQAWLRGEFLKADPDPEAVQLFYLLQSTWTAVSSIGARLRIFAG